MDLASLEIVLAIIAQTVVIGFYIGSVKTVVDRLVKDVESIRADFKEGLKDFYKEITAIKGAIDKVEKVQILHDSKHQGLEGRIRTLELKTQIISNDSNIN